MQTAPSGDDVLQGNVITAGPDGIAQTWAQGNDVQVIPVGQGQPFSACVNTGPDGIADSVAADGDEQRIPLGQGEPHQAGIDDGGDGVLDVAERPNQGAIGGDDEVVGLTVTTGANGILESWVSVGNQGVISVMTSDELLPIPNNYSAEDLDQVRLHLKHE